MPRVKHNASPGFSPLLGPLAPPPETGFRDVTDAAMRLESPVVAAWDLITRPAYEPEDGFDRAAELRKAKLWDDREHFLGVRSKAELRARAAKLARERKDRETLTQAGFGGLVAAMTAGMLSPSIFVPLTAGARGAKAALQGALLGGGAVGAEEALLFSAQQERTAAEVAIGVGAGTVLGGLLGRAAGGMSPRVRVRAEYDMANSPGKTAIPTAIPGVRSTEPLVVPGAGTFRFSRSAEIPEGTEPITIVPEAGGKVPYELNSDSVLVVTPESAPALRKEIGELTDEAVTEYARREGFDAVSFDGWDTAPNTPVFYHGTTAENITEFDVGKIRAVDYDAPFNGFWFSSDPSTGPAMTGAKSVLRASLDIKNPAPAAVWRRVAREVEPESVRPGARSTNDEVRLRLQEMGYDAVQFAGKPAVDRATFEQVGQVSFRSVGGKLYTLVKEDGGAELYDGAVPLPGNHVTGYGNFDDFLRIFGGEEIWAVFDPSQITILGKTTDTPLKDSVKVLNRAALRRTDDVDIPPTMPKFGSGLASPAGAQVTTPARGAGGLKKAALRANFLARSGPVGRVLQSKSRTAQWLMAQMSTGGMRLEGNVRGIASSAGGPAEARIDTWMGQYWQAHEAIQNAYVSYVFNGKPTGAFERARARTRGRFANDKISLLEFQDEVGKAMFSGDAHEIPEIVEAAKAARQHVYDVGLSEMKELRLINDINLGDDPSYLNRIYNHEIIRRHTNRFIDILTEDYAARLTGEFRLRLEKFNEAQRRIEQQISDIELGPEDADALKAEFLEELKQLEAPDDPVRASFVEFEDEIADLRARAKESTDIVEKKELRKRAKDMARRLRGREDATAFRERRAEVRRRLKNLNKNRFAVAAKQQAKFEKIERAEELNLGALNRAARAGQRALRALDKVTDEKLDAEVERLRNVFADVARKYDAGEEQIAKLTLEDAELQRAFEEAPEPPEPTITPFSPRQPAVADPTVDRWKAMVAERDARNAPDAEYRDILSTGSKSLKKGETWRGKVEEFIARREAKAAPADTTGDYRVSFGNVGEGRVIKTGKTWKAVWNKGELTALPSRKAAVEALRAKVVTGDAGADTALLERGLTAQQRQLDRADRLTDVAERLGEAEGLDRVALRALIDEGMQASLEKVNRINSKRAVRTQRLRDQASALAPERVDAEVQRLKASLPARMRDFADDVRRMGAEDDTIDIAGGTADFTAYARDIATQATDRILATTLRLEGIDLVQAERGPELARSLMIDSRKILDFLETDIEVLMRTYIRTVAPDVELTRKFGSPNAHEWLGEKGKLVQEKNERLEELKKMPEGPARERAEKAINEEYRRDFRDLHAVMARLRHTWGLPDDPMGFSARAGRAIRNMNTIVFMGFVTIASLPDIARHSIKWGWQSTFRDGFNPSVNGLKKLKLSARQARLAGTALDPVLHTTIRKLSDIADDIRGGTMAERGLDWMASRMGIVAGYDFFTAGGKMFASAMINAKMMDAVDLLMNGGGTAKEVAEATELLAASGIDRGLARSIWDELNSPGGGDLIDGTWMPNTESWKDPQVVRAYRAALAMNVDDTIITPGVEIPLYANKNEAFRMLMQFKSFMFSSTSKTLVAGLQQNDMAFYTGTMFALAMGAVSYYLRATIVGGDYYEEMLEASPERWLDEAVDRSGILGILGVMREGLQELPPARALGQEIPPLGALSSFSAEGSTRRGGRGLVSSVLGPSFTTGSTLARIASDLDDPTQATVEALGNIVPFSNVPYFRLQQLFEAIADASGLPEDRR